MFSLFYDTNINIMFPNPEIFITPPFCVTFRSLIYCSPDDVNMRIPVLSYVRWHKQGSSIMEMQGLAKLGVIAEVATDVS